jgi:predicted nucleic acid-binding protein
MNDKKIFIDSNILLNLFSADLMRKKFAYSLANKSHLISTQVVNENVNICLKKFKLSKLEGFTHGKYLMANYYLVQITRQSIQYAFEISIKYGYNFWDSLILSTAIENSCDILFSEDMQNRQVIEKSLTIINPFS